MESTKTIGNKIAEARKKATISQAQLAESLFISSQAVGKWERGESMPDITTFIRLAEILGVDLNYFSESFQSVVTETIPVEPSTDLPSEKQKKKLNWNMSSGNWVDADFSGLKNLHEKFSSSNLQRCLFIGSEMSGLLLKGNNVENCDFSNSDISSSRIQNSYFVNNLFKVSSFKNAEFSGSYIMGCDFTDANFTEAVFKSGGLQKNSIANAVWNRTSFIGMNLDDLVFDGTINDCSFENCAFKKVVFQKATLINTFFKNKNLKRVQFIDCQVDRITYAFLKNGKADLSGIMLLEG